MQKAREEGVKEDDHNVLKVCWLQTKFNRTVRQVGLKAGMIDDWFKEAVGHPGTQTQQTVSY